MILLVFAGVVFAVLFGGLLADGAGWLPDPSPVPVGIVALVGAVALWCAVQWREPPQTASEVRQVTVTRNAASVLAWTLAAGMVVFIAGAGGLVPELLVPAAVLADLVAITFLGRRALFYARHPSAWQRLAADRQRDRETRIREVNRRGAAAARDADRKVRARRRGEVSRAAVRQGKAFMAKVRAKRPAKRADDMPTVVLEPVAATVVAADETRVDESVMPDYPPVVVGAATWADPYNPYDVDEDDDADGGLAAVNLGGAGDDEED